MYKATIWYLGIEGGIHATEKEIKASGYIDIFIKQVMTIGLGFEENGVTFYYPSSRILRVEVVPL